jgi:hypothetical protein
MHSYALSKGYVSVKYIIEKELIEGKYYIDYKYLDM